MYPVNETNKTFIYINRLKLFSDIMILRSYNLNNRFNQQDYTQPKVSYCRGTYIIYQVTVYDTNATKLNFAHYTCTLLLLIILPYIL